MRVWLPVVLIGVLSSGCIAEEMILPLETPSATAHVPPPISIDIPPSRVGDEVTYLRAHLGKDPVTWDLPEEKWTTRQTFRLTGIDEITDFAARAVPAIVLDRTEEFLYDQSHPHIHDARWYIDPQTRNVIRTDDQLYFAHSASKAILTSGFLDSYPGEITNLPGIELQGRTFSSASPTTFTRDAIPRSPVSTSGGGGGGGAMSLLGTTLYSTWSYHVETDYEEHHPWEPRARTVWVVGPESVDGTDAVRVSVERAPWYREENVVERTTMWFREGETYPFRYVDESIRLQAGSQPKISRSLAVLESYTAGSDVVAWQSGLPGPIPALERGTSSYAGPDDGAKSSLSYPIADGLRDVQPLAGLVIWRQTNPDSLLVSADLAPGSWHSADRPSWKWQFVFGTPSGDAYVVSTERVDDVPEPVVNDHGRITTGTFDETAVRTTLVTLAELERLWTLHRTERFADRPVNFVHWGFEADPASTLPCVMRSSSNKDHDAHRDFAMGYFGHTTVGSCAEASEDLDHSMVFVDMGAGIVVGLHERVERSF